MSKQIELSICLNDFSFSLRERGIDFLGRLNYWHFYVVKFIMTTILLVNCEILKLDGQELVTFFFHLFYIGVSAYLREYNHVYVRVVNFATHILMCVCSIFFYLQRKEIINASQVVAFLIFLPISLQLSWLIEKNTLSIKKITTKRLEEEKTPTKFVQITRKILSGVSLSYSDYQKNQNSVQLEELITQHILYCTEYPYCFCNFKNESKEEYIDNIISSDKREQFLQYFMKKWLLNGRSNLSRANKESNINLDFVYCTYLLEICGSKVLCLYELNKMIREQRISIREQMYAHHLIQRIKNRFLVNNGMLDFHTALNYEKLMQETFNSFETSLQTKSNLFSILNNDHIDLINLSQESEKLVNQRKELKILILNLSSINSQHPTYKLLQQGYLDNFAFIETKNSLKKLTASHSHRKGENNQLLMNSAMIGRHKDIGDLVSKDENNMKIFFDWNKEELFQDKSCVIFMRITGNEIGNIIQAQKNFSQLFDYTDIIGRSINIIIPNCISVYHTKYITNFINRIDKESQFFTGKYMPLQIAVNKQGWAVPISLRMQIEFLSEFNELGLSCMIKKYASENQFALFDATSFKIQALSEQFFHQQFSSIFSIKDLSHVRFNRIIPSLMYLVNQHKEQHSHQINYYETFAFLPDKGEAFDCKTNFMKQINLQKDSLTYLTKSHINIYSVRLKLTFVNEMFQRQCVLEIEHFKQISLLQDLKEGWLQAELQFKSIFPEQFILDKTLGIFNQEHRHSQSEKEESSNDDDNQINSLENIVDVTTKRAQQSIQLQVPSSNLENVNYAYNYKSVEFSPMIQHQNLQNVSFTKNHIPDQFNLDTEQLEQKYNFLQSNGLLNSISSPRNILSSTTLISPQVQLGVSSLQSTNLSKIKLISDLAIKEHGVEGQHSYQEYGQSNLQNQLHQESPSKSNKRNIWQYDQIGQFKSEKTKELKNEGYNNNIQNSDSFSDKQQKEESLKTKKIKSENKNAVASSIKSTLSHTSELKKTINSKIMRAKKGVFITFINVLSLLAAIPLITVTLYQFFMMTSSFSQEKSDFQLIPWPMSLRAILSASLNYVIFIKYIDYDIFPGIKQSWSDYRAQNVQRIQSEMSEYYGLYETFLKEDKNSHPYFQNVTEFPVNMVMMRDEASQKNKKFNKTLSFQAFIYNLYTSVQRQGNMIYNEYNEEGTVIENFPYFNVQVIGLINNIQKRAVSILNDIYDQILIVMEIVMVISFIVISAVVPANYILQNQVEEILKLFATLPPLFLQGTLYFIKLTQQDVNNSRQLFNVHYEKEKAKSPQKKQNQYKFLQKGTHNAAQNMKKKFQQQTGVEMSNINLTNFKKKNISTTSSSITKVSCKIVIYCVIAFSVLVIQPITNKLLVESFNSQAQINISLLCKAFFGLKIFQILQRTLFMAYSLYNPIIYQILIIILFKIDTLYDLKAHFCSNMVLNYSYLFSVMVKDNKLYNQAYYKARAPAFFALNNQKISNLRQVIQQQVTTSRYQMNYYQEFLFEIINGNMCDALNKYPQFYNQTYLNFDYNTCNSLQQSILTKGFQISTIYFLNQFPILYEILSTTDPTKVQQAVIQWQSTFDIRKFDEFADFLLKVITTLKDFMVARNDDYLDFMITIQIVLLIFQCLALLIVFYFGWFTFYQNKIAYLNSTMYSLTLIDINQIIENPYIMSYLNSH